MRRRRFTAVVSVVAILVLALGLVMSSRSPSLPVDRDQAMEIARDYFASPGAHEAGATVATVHVSGGDLVHPDGKAAWKVNVTGAITEPSGVTYVSAMWLSVDATTGLVTILAQG